MEINSLQNTHVKQWAKLKQKKYRDQYQLFLVEGEHLIEEAEKAGLIECIIALEEKKHMFPSYEHYIVTRAILDKLSATVSGSSIMALCHFPDRSTMKGNRFVLLDRVQDPGNIGTILRSAYAFGYENIILSPGCADIYNEKVIRSTQGALFHLKTMVCPLQEYIHELKSKNIPVYATALHKDSIPLSSLPAQEKFAIIFGNEGQGVCDEVLAESDETVFIEMEQFESLNVAVAAGICLYAMNHKR